MTKSLLSREEPMRVYNTTGLTEAEITDLVERVYPFLPKRPTNSRRPVLGIWNRVQLTMMALRTNMTQRAIGEIFHISQSTVCRILSAIIPAVDKALSSVGLPIEQAAASRPLLIDGSYVRTGNRHGIGKQLYSGKRGCQCVNIQVACDLSGTLIAVSIPSPGARHDRKCLELTGWEKVLSNANWIADSGYIGTTAITPIKRKIGGQLTENQKEYNRNISRLRTVVERCIAHLKNWKILKTGYRGPLHKLETIIQTIARIQLYTLGW